MTHAIRSIFITALIVLVGSFGLATDAHAAKKKKKIDKKVEKTLGKFHKNVTDSEEFWAAAEGVLVFPPLSGAGSVGFGILPGVTLQTKGRGEFGSGALIINNETVDYFKITKEAHVKVFGGIKKKRLFIFFMTEEALANFQNFEEWEIGVDATVTDLQLDEEGRFIIEDTGAPILAFYHGKWDDHVYLSTPALFIEKIYPK